MPQQSIAYGPSSPGRPSLATSRSLCPRAQTLAQQPHTSRVLTLHSTYICIYNTFFRSHADRECGSEAAESCRAGARWWVVCRKVTSYPVVTDYCYRVTNSSQLEVVARLGEDVHRKYVLCEVDYEGV